MVLLIVNDSADAADIGGVKRCRPKKRREQRHAQTVDRETHKLPLRSKSQARDLFDKGSRTTDRIQFKRAREVREAGEIVADEG